MASSDEIQSAFDTADAILALEGFLPDPQLRRYQADVAAGRCTIAQAVERAIAEAQAEQRRRAGEL